jgi:hypothetical protein
MKQIPWIKAAALAAIAILIGAWASTAVVAEEAHLYLAPYGFTGNMGGGGQVADGGNGTSFDLEDTLGLDPGDSLRGVDGFFHLAMFQLTFGYQENGYSGASTLSQDLDFNGETFPTGEEIHTDLDYKHYKAMLGMSFGVPMVSFGFLVGAHLIEADTRIEAPGVGLGEHEDFSIPVPAVGATLGVHPLKQLTIHGEITGMSANVSGIEEKMVDAFASLEYLFLGGKFGIMAGYRYFDLEASDDDEDNHVDLKFHGPYAGIALHL